jgi:galactokinase
LHLGNFKDAFRKLYGLEPHVFRAAGRVNLIGEHTDYNDGFVFPAAIDLFTWVAIAPRDDRHLAILTENLHEQADYDLDSRAGFEPGHWTSYVCGVARALEEAGQRLRGAALLIQGEVPLGGGVSSSASLEVAVACALLANSGLSLECRRVAKICQRAENEFAGAHTGIMDQLASSCAVAGRALMVDCRSLEFRTLPLPAGVRLVICNSMIRRELSSSNYNSRREECEQGVRILAGLISGVRALRDVSSTQLEQFRSALPEIVYRRCRHVVTEDERVLEFARALEHDQLDVLRAVMAASHRSLRDDFQVSCKELDTLVEIAERLPGNHGARMTGAGFGGCTINLVESESVDSFCAAISAEYERRTRLKPEIYVCNAAGGAGPAEPESAGTQK